MIKYNEAKVVCNIYNKIYEDAIIEIESLRDFYEDSSKYILKKQLDFDSEFSIGIQIGNMLDDISNEKSYEDRVRKLQEINETIIDGKYKFSDLIQVYIRQDKSARIEYTMMDLSVEKSKRDPNKAVQAKYKLNNYEMMLNTSTLSNIIIVFESFLGKIISVLLHKDTKKYFKDEKIELATIFNRDLNDIIEDSISDYVEKMLYDGIKAYEKIIESEKMQIDKHECITHRFKEIYFRRNVFVHNNGRANKHYLKGVDEKLKKDIAENDKLICDSIYIAEAINILIKNIFSISCELINALPKVGEDFDLYQKLAFYSFQFLGNKEYNIAAFMYKRLSASGNISFELKTLFKINYLNSLKQLGQNKELKSELDKFDLSIAKDKYIIAEACLKDQNEKVFELLRETYPDSFKAYEIRDWPIFIDFRKTEQYVNFVELYKSDFEVNELLNEESDSDLIDKKYKVQDCTEDS